MMYILPITILLRGVLQYFCVLEVSPALENPAFYIEYGRFLFIILYSNASKIYFYFSTHLFLKIFFVSESMGNV